MGHYTFDYFPPVRLCLNDPFWLPRLSAYFFSGSEGLRVLNLQALVGLVVRFIFK